MKKQLKKYNIILKKEYSENDVLIDKGDIIFSQDEPFTIEQISEAKTDGVPYIIGFGNYTKIPFEYLSFTILKEFNI